MPKKTVDPCLRRGDEKGRRGDEKGRGGDEGRRKISRKPRNDIAGGGNDSPLKAASQRKTKANRENARKSTGPKTKEGKAASSQNAVKHGLYAKAIVLNSPHLKENPDEYVELLGSLHEELKPKGALQEHLVHIIADCVWRRRRVIAAETARVNDQLDDIDPEDIENVKLICGDYDRDNRASMRKLKADVERTVARRVGKYQIPFENHARNLLRYEMRLDRQLSRALRELRRLKAMVREEERENLYPPQAVGHPAYNSSVGVQDLEPDGTTDRPSSLPPDTGGPRGGSSNTHDEHGFAYDLSDIPLASPEELAAHSSDPSGFCTETVNPNATDGTPDKTTQCGKTKPRGSKPLHPKPKRRDSAGREV